MSKPVLFVTGLGKDKARAENISVLYEAYPGEKEYISGHDPDANIIIQSGKYDLMVIDVFPIVKPKKAIMIWHAIQGGKYIGLDQKGSYYKPQMAQLIDYIIVAGYGGGDMFYRCTGVDMDKIIPLGMPRTDRYFRKDGADAEPPHYLLDGSKRIYLFAPTFRGGSDPAMPQIDWKKIDSRLKDDEIFLVKPHPYGSDFAIYGCEHVYQLYPMEPTYPYLRVADVVITDYSSIMFDAYLMEKPVVLFEKAAGYVQQRGMYLSYPVKYSSRYATDEVQMIRLAREADGLTDVERNCREYVATFCDGNSCERICRFIWDVNNDVY